MVAISSQSLADEIRRQQQLTQDITNAQTQISSGKKLSAPSDDIQSWVQISDIGRMQASYAAWTGNVGYAQSRAAKASTNLNEINTLMNRAHELVVQAASTTTGDTGRAAIAAELQSLRQTLSDLLNEKDYQGVPVFDDGATVNVPVGRGIQLEAVATRQGLSEGIDVNGTPMSLDDILASAITAVQTGDETARSAALGAVATGLNHVIDEQAKQGIRADRLTDAASHLDDVSLSLSERRSALEETDLTDTITRMQQKLLTLQAAQAALARINQKSLFDLIS